MKSVGFEGIYLASTQGFGLLDLVLLWSLLAANRSGPLACLAPKFFSHPCSRFPATPTHKNPVTPNFFSPPFLFLPQPALSQKWVSKFFQLFLACSPHKIRPTHSWFWQNFLSLLPSHSRFLVKKNWQEFSCFSLIFLNYGVTYL